MAKVSCILRHQGFKLILAYGWARPGILRHQGFKLILAYSWARPAILIAGKGRGGRFLLSTIALKAYSSYTTGPIDLILGWKHEGDL